MRGLLFTSFFLFSFKAFSQEDISEKAKDSTFPAKKLSRANKFLVSFLRQRSYDSFFNFNVNTVKAHRNSNVEYTFTTDKTKLL
jgi:hypothetical protein